MPSVKLIAGLGNPDNEHQETRHNAGFWFLDRLAARHHVSFGMDNRFFGESSRIQEGQTDCRLLKPMTYMNDSGRAVQAMMNFFRLTPGELLVVHDEIDLAPGAVRLKVGGGHAGHNGVRDIIDCIGSRDFVRIRIGVGHPGNKDKVIGSVLGRPRNDERELIDIAIANALDVMPLVFAGEHEKAMTQLHQKQATSD